MDVLTLFNYCHASWSAHCTHLIQLINVYHSIDERGRSEREYMKREKLSRKDISSVFFVFFRRVIVCFVFLLKKKKVAPTTKQSDSLCRNVACIEWGRSVIWHLYRKKRILLTSVVDQLNKPSCISMELGFFFKLFSATPGQGTWFIHTCQCYVCSWTRATCWWTVKRRPLREQTWWHFLSTLSEVTRKDLLLRSVKDGKELYHVTSFLFGLAHGWSTTFV